MILHATPFANIANVEVELYHVFPEDSVDPPSGNVPSRVFSSTNVGVDSATRWYALSIIAISTLGLIGAGLTGNRKIAFPGDGRSPSTKIGLWHDTVAPHDLGTFVHSQSISSCLSHD